MREIIAVKYCKTKIGKEESRCNSLLFFQKRRISILSVSLTVTLLFCDLGFQSALAQCAGLCMDDQNIPQIKIATERVDTGYQESANAYFGPEEATGNN